ncbi:Protein of unknown function [Gryllus bimaculatus]|nr:Protein of unknown function [Gryllus bimaculatus]
MVASDTRPGDEVPVSCDTTRHEADGRGVPGLLPLLRLGRAGPSVAVAREQQDGASQRQPRGRPPHRRPAACNTRATCQQPSRTGFEQRDQVVMNGITTL